MGIIGVKYSLQRSFASLCDDLKLLEFVELLGDYHEARLAVIDQLGMSRNSAPAKSLIRDRECIEKSWSVSLRMEDGALLNGQLRPTGLLLSTSGELNQNDAHLLRLVELLREKTTVEEVEIA